jgi:putative transposase
MAGRDDVYLLTACLYIHLNPVRAGLEKDPPDFRWSSCGLYTADDAPQSFVMPGFILNLLSGENSEKREKYRHLLQHGAKLDMEEVMEEKEAIERFRRALSSKVPSFLKWIARKKKTVASSGVDLLDIDELEKRVQEMKATRPNKPESRKAKRFLIEQLIARGYNREEIADWLGMSRKSVYNLLKSTLSMFISLFIFLPISSQSYFG